MLEGVFMKIYVIFSALLVFFSTIQSNATSVPEQISNILKDKNVNEKIEDVVKSNTGQENFVMFSGVKMSQFQGACGGGNYTSYELLFYFKSKDNEELKICQLPVVYGRCGSPLDEVTMVSKKSLIKDLYCYDAEAL